METNGVNEAVWLNKQVLVKESTSTIQYHETHIGKKRKLTLNSSDSDDEIRIEATYDQLEQTTQQRQLTYGPTNGTIAQNHHTNNHYSNSVANVDDFGSFYSSSTYSSRLHCSQDIMGNLFSLSDDDSIESGSSKPVEKVKKKKKKKKHRERERDKDGKKDCIDLESLSSSSEDNNTKKDPRMGLEFQCDMSVLDNGEGDRNEFIGEQIWNPETDLDAVDKFLQEIQLKKPLINQFDFVPFVEYIPATTIIAQDKLLAFLKRFNYDFERTKKFLSEQKLVFTDRGFSVRLSLWRASDIKIFEKALKFMFEQEGEFDLDDVKKAMAWKKMKEICEFYYAWKHTKRFQAWKDESNCPVERKRDRGNKLRSTNHVDYNDQTSLVLRNLDNRQKLKLLRPCEDSKVIKMSNEGDHMAYSITINAQIMDLEKERKNCLEKCITKKNTKVDTYFLEYI